MKKVSLSSFIFVLSFASLAVAAELERATPESQGVSSSAIAAWLAASDGIVNLHGFVIARHGKTIAEGAWAPFDPLTRPHMLYSHSKSFTSTAIGFLADEGKVDLDERIAEIFADKMPANPPHRRAAFQARRHARGHRRRRVDESEDVQGHLASPRLHPEGRIRVQGEVSMG